VQGSPVLRILCVQVVVHDLSVPTRDLGNDKSTRGMVVGVEWFSVLGWDCSLETQNQRLEILVLQYPLSPTTPNIAAPPNPLFEGVGSFGCRGERPSPTQSRTNSIPANSFTGRPHLFIIAKNGSGSSCSTFQTPFCIHLPSSINAAPIMAGTPVVYEMPCA
jgi:hypothetical protein